MSNRPYYTASESTPAAGIYAVNGSTYALTAPLTSSTRYFNYFVYATTSIANPIHIFVETVAVGNIGGYTSVTNARAASLPNINSVGLSPEYKLLYRVIVNGAGLVQTVTTADDYRAQTSLAGGVSASTTASSVSFAPYSSVTASTVQTAIQQLARVQLGVFKNGLTSVAQPQAFSYPYNLTCTAVTKQLNCSDYSVTIGATTYNTASTLVGVSIPANTTITFNDLTISGAGVIANALFTFNE